MPEYCGKVVTQLLTRNMRVSKGNPGYLILLRFTLVLQANIRIAS